MICGLNFLNLLKNHRRLHKFYLHQNKRKLYENLLLYCSIYLLLTYLNINKNINLKN